MPQNSIPRPKRSKVKISASRKQLAAFRKIAKKTFPIEEFGILLGTRNKNNEYTLKGIILPTDRAKYSTVDKVDTPQIWFEAANLLATDHGCEVIGDIHTHCYDLDAGEELVKLHPSGEDWNSISYVADIYPTVKVFGIMRIIKKNGILRTRCAFFAAPDAVSLKIHE